MTSTLHIQPPVTDQDIQIGGQDHHQDQMTDIENKVGTAEEGAEGRGQEIIKMGVVDMIVHRGSSTGPRVLTETTETQIIDNRKFNKIRNKVSTTDNLKKKKKRK